MSWGKEWPKPEVFPPCNVKQPWPDPLKIAQSEMDDAVKAYQDAIVYGSGFTKDGKHVPLEKVYNNKVPTHDPYTNPNAQIYYQCNCGAILDSGTKSFAALNNCASEKGWKVRWKKDGQGYEPFCVDCGKDVE